MKTFRSEDGFSLIELLTVIAIIAILAGIIFPVMATVKQRAKETQCMTNLHDIAMALKMFKTDNGYYPQTLAGFVSRDGQGNVIPFERTKGDALYPEYIKSFKAFHCPLSPTNKTDAVAVLPNGNSTVEFYAYDSYDVYTPRPVDTVDNITANEVRYTINWASDASAVGVLPPYPPGKVQDSDDLRAYDYKRQLKFRYAPDDTVVTWCNYHERVGDSKSMIPVLFLSGTVERMPAVDVNQSKWRTLPKK
jgi:prepilin-type N-terminal cleavage/methylation domain-containing protein